MPEQEDKVIGRDVFKRLKALEKQIEEVNLLRVEIVQMRSLLKEALDAINLTTEF